MNPLLSLTDSLLNATRDYTLKLVIRIGMYKYVFTFVFIRCKIDFILLDERFIEVQGSGYNGPN